jgi:ribosomal protein S18 acetylase RimI-like enzyme
VIGLRHLRAAGLQDVLLYVDESNRPAIRLYESLGFVHWGTDVVFRHEPSHSPSRKPRSSDQPKNGRSTR